MRRLLPMLLLGVACRTARPECVAPGDPVTTIEATNQVGRFQIDKEGCLFLDVLVDAGVRRTAKEGRYAGVWRVDFETLESPGLTVENNGPTPDGGWLQRSVSTFGDAGWEWSEVQSFTDTGQPASRVRHLKRDAINMVVTEEKWMPDGGWWLNDTFEAAINQR